MKVEKFMQTLILLAEAALALFLFTSLSLSASYHFLITLPGLYFLWHGRHKLRDLPWSFKYLLGFTLCALLSLAVNWGNLEHGFLYLSKVKYFLFCLLGWIALRFGGEKVALLKNRRNLLRLFLFSSAIASLSGIYALYTGFNPLRFRAVSHLTRASGMYGMTISYSFSVAALAVILLVLCKNHQKLKSFVHLPALLLCAGIALLGLYLSSGRGAIVGLIYALPFVFFLRKPKWLVAGLLSVSLALGAYVYLNESGFFSKYSKLPNSLARQLGHHSGEVRKTHARAAFYMIEENPLLGVGYRAVEEKIVSIKKKYSLPEAEFSGHAHNNFLEVWAGTGTIGFLFFIVFLFCWYLESYRRRDLFGDACCVFLIYYAVSGIFHPAIIDGETLFFFLGLYTLTAVKV